MLKNKHPLFHPLHCSQRARRPQAPGLDAENRYSPITAPSFRTGRGSHVGVGELPPTPTPQGSFRAKAEVCEAWLAEAETVLLTAGAQLDEREKVLNQQRDFQVARAREMFEQVVEEAERAMHEAERVREQAVQEAEQDREQEVAWIIRSNTSKMREMEDKIQVIRVEAQEWRQMATLLQGQSPPPASAPAPALPVGASTRSECVICADNPATFVIVPCGHVCLCERCKDALLARGGDCPICRGKIENIFKVFL